MTADPTGCDLLSSLFPPGLNDSLPPGILPWWDHLLVHHQVRKAERRSGTTVVVPLRHELWANMTSPSLGRQDLFWSYSHRPGESRLPPAVLLPYVLVMYILAEWTGWLHSINPHFYYSQTVPALWSWPQTNKVALTITMHVFLFKWILGLQGSSLKTHGLVMVI